MLATKIKFATTDGSFGSSWKLVVVESASTEGVIVMRPEPSSDGRHQRRLLQVSHTATPKKNAVTITVDGNVYYVQNYWDIESKEL